ncbi:MAG: hypothetical protein ABIS01_02390 [Ferruginibacter sp.]
MKKLYILLILISIAGMAGAQNDQPSEKRQQNIEALKVAFISKELDLTPDEAQRFWPLYNQYSKELKATIKDDADILERDENVLNVRKKYKGQFNNVLGQERTNRVFSAEGKFRQLLIKTMRNRYQRKANRQLLQRE